MRSSDKHAVSTYKSTDYKLDDSVIKTRGSSMGEVGNVVSLTKTHVKIELTQGGVPGTIKTWQYNNVMSFCVGCGVYQKILKDEEIA